MLASALDLGCGDGVLIGGGDVLIGGGDVLARGGGVLTCGGGDDDGDRPAKPDNNP